MEDILPKQRQDGFALIELLGNVLAVVEFGVGGDAERVIHGRGEVAGSDGILTGIGGNSV